MNIIKYYEFNILKDKKYKCIELKEICKYYKLKQYGKKNILIERIYKFLRETNYILKIQKKWRTFLLKKFNNYKGGFILITRKCVNEIDFLTMENIRDIDYNQFFSFKCKDGLIYGFNIISIYNLFIKSSGIIKNPYNRNIISNNIFIKICNIIKIGKYLNLNINSTFEEQVIIDPYKKIESRTLCLFQKINELGNYSQFEWFISLNKDQLILFIKHLYDIWVYRASLTINMRRDICSTEINPFRHIRFNELLFLDKNTILNNILNVMELFVCSGINKDCKILGSNYVLCALTLVSNDAAIYMPYLYQSVAI